MLATFCNAGHNEKNCGYHVLSLVTVKVDEEGICTLQLSIENGTTNTNIFLICYHQKYRIVTVSILIYFVKLFFALTRTYETLVDIKELVSLALCNESCSRYRR